MATQHNFPCLHSEQRRKVDFRFAALSKASGHNYRSCVRTWYPIGTWVQVLADSDARILLPILVAEQTYLKGSFGTAIVSGKSGVGKPTETSVLTRTESRSVASDHAFAGKLHDEGWLFLCHKYISQNPGQLWQP